MDQDLTNADKQTILEAIIIILEERNVDPETIALIKRIKQA